MEKIILISSPENFKTSTKLEKKPIVISAWLALKYSKFKLEYLMIIPLILALLNIIEFSVTVLIYLLFLSIYLFRFVYKIIRMDFDIRKNPFDIRINKDFE